MKGEHLTKIGNFELQNQLEEQNQELEKNIGTWKEGKIPPNYINKNPKS